MKDKSKLYDFSTFLILILITLFFTVFGKGFLKPGNISNIINQASFLAIIGVVQLVVILTGGINLSIGSIMALSTVLCGPMLVREANVPVILPVFLVILFGAAVGTVNGLMITRLNIPAFLATFATMYVARGAAWLYIGKGVFYGINDQIRFWAMGELVNLNGFRITMPIVLVALFLVVMWFLLAKTTLGRRLYFTGSNPVAAEFSGIPTKRVIVLAHLLSGLISGIAGIMYVARINAADANLGTQYHFDAISVALIGGAVMSGGVGSVWGVVGGALIISVIQSGMNNMQIPTEIQKAFLGVIIILAVFFNAFVQDQKMKAGNDKPVKKGNTANA